MKPEIVYNELVTDREDFLNYAEDVAELTSTAMPRPTAPGPGMSTPWHQASSMR